jgi:hypothetical protein
MKLVAEDETQARTEGGAARVIKQRELGRMSTREILSVSYISELLVLILATVSLGACYAVPSGSAASPVALQTEEIEKLKSAEYQDDISAMKFEDSNQKLGNYYESKALEAHRLIDQMEKGNQINEATIAKVLNTDDAENYDNRPPVPLDDEIGNGY